MRGHDAWSCDLLPSERAGQHIQGDFREALKQHWDFIGFHNDCRVMANSGVRWLYKAGQPVYAEVLGRTSRYHARIRNEARWGELLAAAEMFNLSLDCRVPGYVENSVMHCHAKKLIRREQDQTIQPWWFGVPRFKATCLWLRGIPPLEATDKLIPPLKGTQSHKEWSAVHRASPGKNRWKERSRTFPGIANAMAEQWGAQSDTKSP